MNKVFALSIPWRKPIAVDGMRVIVRTLLTAVTVLAGVLRFANLDSLGYANHYYTAAVVSMLQSWHNWFFAAAEPGGSVSVDKPPVGLWVQTISAKIFGVSGFSVLLPQIIAGILSILLVYHLVRRKFGAVAGLVAALALAVTPVVVATDRNNTMDSTLILTLLLAAWALIRATESGRLRFLLLGAILVGTGFNIKMLQAYLVLPALFVLYLLGSRERLLPKIGKQSLATIVLLLVSFSWVTIVDLTPADLRPYVGGNPGALRLFIAPLSNQMSRLLPFGIAALIFLALRSRLQWPLSERHQAIVLWGGWLVTGGIFFSVAGFFHEYYLSMLAPALAALIGIGVAELWAMDNRNTWFGATLLLVAAAVTAWFEYRTASAFITSVWWQPLVLALLVAGAVALLAAAFLRVRTVGAVGFVCVMSALLSGAEYPGRQIPDGRAQLHARC